MSKESGAQGRKRRKLEQVEISKSSNFLQRYLTKPVESPTENVTQDCVSDPEEVADDSPQVLNIVESVNIGSEDNTDSTDNVGESIEETIENSDEFRSLDVIRYKDIGFLQSNEIHQKFVISNQIRDEIIKVGSEALQNKDGPFHKVDNRAMNYRWFTKMIGTNGELINRTWLCYSPKKKAAFCIACILFSNSEAISNLEKPIGFSNWKGQDRISMHENSPNHRLCFVKWKEAEKIVNEGRDCIDVELATQIENSKRKWRDILLRLLNCTQFLAKQNLPFRGHREDLTDNYTNKGNFIEVINLIAKFDPLLEQHLRQARENPRSVSYLSPEIQNEFISLMASTVRKNIISRIQKSRYFGILVDSTPDLVSSTYVRLIFNYFHLYKEVFATTVQFIL